MRGRTLLLTLTTASLLYLYVVDVPFILRGERLDPVAVQACTPTPVHPLTITSITKNSASYIREWLEYHLLIGVGHFFLLDNNSQDNLTEVLAPYVARNVVTLLPWDDVEYRDGGLQLGVKTQQNGIVYALARYGCRSEWTALIDDDEFLLPKGGRSVREILEDYSDYGGVLLGWAWFGSNGHVDKPSTLVIESYTRRRGTLDRLCKPIIQPKYFLRMKAIHFPVFVPGRPLVSETFDAATKTHDPTCTGDILQLNHYKVKSMEDWIGRVRERGAVAGPRWGDAQRDFYRWDYNEVEDREILKYLPELKKRLNEGDHSGNR